MGISISEHSRTQSANIIRKHDYSSLVTVVVAFALLAVVALVVLAPPADAAGPHKITFDKNGGTGTQSDGSVADGGTYYLPSATTFTAPEDKAFKGWSKSSNGAIVESLTNVTSDTTVYAIWSIAYTISYKSNGGTGSQGDQLALAGEDFTLPSKTSFKAPTGKEFKGWSTTSDGTIIKKLTNVKSDTKVYAIWSTIYYTVSFDQNGGTGSQMSMKAAYGVVLNLPTTTTINAPAGSSFEYWAVSPDSRTKVTSTPSMYGDKEYYAIWGCTVTFDGRGGHLMSDDSKRVVRGDAIGNLPGIAKMGETFDGWYMDADCKTPLKESTVITTNIKAYAKWNVDPINYYVGGGEIVVMAITILGIMYFFRWRNRS